MTRAVVVHPDADVLAQAVAARLLTRLLDLQSLRRPVHLVLTGGTVGIRSLAAVAASPLRDAVDWTGVHVWWGDERFVPDGDPERNETQARDALLTALGDALPRANVHPMPARSADVPTPEDAARRYGAELAQHAAAPGTAPGDPADGGSTDDPAGSGSTADLADGGPTDDPADGGSADAAPAFDVLLLGMGPDGHVASLFPGHPALDARGVVVGVHGSPKPPPERVSLTFDAVRAAREVWVVAAGEEKAEAVASALAGAPVTTTPAAGAVGRQRTLWLLDAAAARAEPGAPAEPGD